MTAISAWVLSIVGIIVLSILVDLILPNGQMAKFIKNIFGYLIIIVILSPIFSFFSNKNFSVSDIFETSSTEVQTNFVASVNRQFLDNIEESIESSCFEEGIKFVEIGIDADIFEYEIQIKKINVDLSNVVLEKKLPQGLKPTVLEIIFENIKIDKELIEFYE